MLFSKNSFAVLSVLVSGVLSAVPAFGYKIGAADNAALVSLLGREKVESLKVEDVSKAGHSLTIVRSDVDGKVAYGGKDMTIADDKGFFACNAYLEVMTRVVLDEKTVQLNVVHRTPSEETKRAASGLYYDWNDIVSFLKGNPLSTPESRAAAKKSGIVAAQTADVTILTIKNYGYKKHHQLMEKCYMADGRLTSLDETRQEVRNFRGVLAKLETLASGPAAGATKKDLVPAMR